MNSGCFWLAIRSPGDKPDVNVELRRLPVPLFCVLCLFACGNEGPPAPVELIPDIPPTQQRVINRSDLLEEWPFSVRTGSLGCVSGAVVFRTGNLTYAMNDRARARGWATPEPIRVRATSPLPTNPLPGVPQDTRMAIFAQAARCESMTGAPRAETTNCKKRVRESHGLSEADLKQIEAEGAERFWSPVVRPLMTLEPLIDMGLKLCRQ
jgi:hypothetical protein